MSSSDVDDFDESVLIPSAFEAEEDDILPFPLFELPSELTDYIIACADDRPPHPDAFPQGPSQDLLQFRLASTYIHDKTRAAVWKSVLFRTENKDTEKRGLRALEDLIEASSTGRMGTLPIRELSLDAPAAGAADLGVAVTECAAVSRIIQLLPTLHTLILIRCDFLPGMSAVLLSSVLEAPNLKSLRLNQCRLDGKLPDLKTFKPLTGLKTLQIMHSSSALLGITAIAPNVVSLLLWPKTRKLGPRLVESIVQKLGTLRFLSLDVVSDPEVITRIGTGIHRRILAGEDVPIEELFLEGAQLASDRAELIRILGQTTSLIRLALYNLGNVKPSLFAQIAAALPSLQGLTIVQGACSYPSVWESPLEHYVAELEKFKQLTFFAFDRLTPTDSTLEAGLPTTIKRKATFVYQTMRTVGRGVPSLLEAVSITQDASEGSAGYFATYQREGKSTRMELKYKTVQDFLVGHGRWCVI